MDKAVLTMLGAYETLEQMQDAIRAKHGTAFLLDLVLGAVSEENPVAGVALSGAKGLLDMELDMNEVGEQDKENKRAVVLSDSSSYCDTFKLHSFKITDGTGEVYKFEVSGATHSIVNKLNTLIWGSVTSVNKALKLKPEIDQKTLDAIQSILRGLAAKYLGAGVTKITMEMITGSKTIESMEGFINEVLGVRDNKPIVIDSTNSQTQDALNIADLIALIFSA